MKPLVFSINPGLEPQTINPDHWVSLHGEDVDTGIPSSEALPMRRYDPRRPDKIETLPYNLNKPELDVTLRALRAAKREGIEIPDSSTLAAMIMREGREDMGMGPSALNLHNAGAARAAEKVYAKNPQMDDSQLSLIAALVDKLQVAKRLHIPLPRAWNGTGTSKYGQTGQDYADYVTQAQIHALRSPKNKEFMAYVEQGLR